MHLKLFYPKTCASFTASYATGWYVELTLFYRAEFKGFVYYFRVVFEGLEVHRFSVGANANCKNTLKGLKNFCGTKIGTGAGAFIFYPSANAGK